MGSQIRKNSFLGLTDFLGSIPDHNFWDQSQSFTSGINPRTSFPGSIPEHHSRDLSQSNISGIYPRATDPGSIPEHHFLDQWEPHFITDVIIGCPMGSQSVQKLSLGSDAREQFLVLWDLIPEPHFLTAGIDPRVQKRLIIFTCFNDNG